MGGAVFLVCLTLLGANMLTVGLAPFPLPFTIRFWVLRSPLMRRFSRRFPAAVRINLVSAPSVFCAAAEAFAIRNPTLH
jgi:hypothetical protein